ncbi:hypothetical protein EV1_046834 [Malus domestica]
MLLKWRQSLLPLLLRLIRLRFKIVSLQFLSFVLLLMLRREWMSFSISPEDLLAFIFKVSIGEVVGEVSAQTGAAGGEAPDEGVATEQARVAYAAVGVGVELCKVVSHRVGSWMPYLQKQTKVKLIDYVACRQWIKLCICALACSTFHKNVQLHKSSAALLLEGQAVGSLLESVGYLSALGSSFRIPGQSSIECTANLGASHRASSYTRAARLIHVWIFGV